MTTLLHLTQAVADMQETLSREQRFAQTSCDNLLSGVRLLREALDAMERDIRTAFEERDRAMSKVIGSTFTTIENTPAPEAIEAKPAKAAKTASPE